MGRGSTLISDYITIVSILTFNKFNSNNVTIEKFTGFAGIKLLTFDNPSYDFKFHRKENFLHKITIENVVMTVTSPYPITPPQTSVFQKFYGNITSLQKSNKLHQGELNLTIKWNRKMISKCHPFSNVILKHFQEHNFEALFVIG